MRTLSWRLAIALARDLYRRTRHAFARFLPGVETDTTATMVDADGEELFVLPVGPQRRLRGSNQTPRYRISMTYRVPGPTKATAVLAKYLDGL